MKAAEARKFIDTFVKYHTNYCPKHGWGVYYGTVEVIQGKNVLINNDWKWLPDILKMEKVWIILWVLHQ